MKKETVEFLDKQIRIKDELDKEEYKKFIERESIITKQKSDYANKIREFFQDLPPKRSFLFKIKENLPYVEGWTPKYKYVDKGFDGFSKGQYIEIIVLDTKDPVKSNNVIITSGSGFNDSISFWDLKDLMIIHDNLDWFEKDLIRQYQTINVL